MSSKNRFYVDIMAMHNEVTGSCILNVVKLPDGTTKKFVVDCGLFQEAQYSDLNKSLPFKVENIDYVFLTHVHVDHCGRLPLLVNQRYSEKIYMSNDSVCLLKPALSDSFKILNRRAKVLNEQPLFSESDVEETLSRTVPVNFEETIKLDDNIKVTFFKNGHLQGAATILVQISYHNHIEHFENINLLYTGDYNNKNMFFNVPEIPKWVRQLPLTIIQESTYGYMKSSEIVSVFQDNVLDALSKGKEVLIPVFSLGRSQEVMFTLKKWQDSGLLDRNIPIYYDGKLCRKYTDMYPKLSIKNEAKDFKPANFYYVDGSEMRGALLANNNCKIILTTSGMGSYGPAQTYLPVYLSKKNALIHFTGYLAEGTLGRHLMDCANDNYIEVSGLQIKKQADVKTTAEFSAHAKQDELLDFLKKFDNLKLVLINHGSKESKDIYSTLVADEVSCKAVGLLGRDYFFRIDGYGLVKSWSTKF